MNRRNDNESGAVAILFAVCAVTLFLIAALVIDLGLARDTRRSSQNASDASALAAANVLYPTGNCTLVNPSGTNTAPCYSDAIQAAKDYASANFGVTSAQWASCTDTKGYWYPAGNSPCITFTDDALGKTMPVKPTKVRVFAPVESVETGFGVLAGVSNIDVASSARAGISAGVSSTCGLCFLGSINTTKFDVQVDGAGIALNGDVTANKGDWKASSIAVLHPALTDDKLTATPAPTTTTAFTDPWATKSGIPPSMTGLANRANGNPCSLGPGKYGTPNIPNSACTLQPGLYVITGTWAGKNNTVLSGAGVTLYFTCGTAATPAACNSSGQAGGVFDMKNGAVNFSAPTTGDRANLGIIYDRNNTSAMYLQGNGAYNMTGAIYAPRSNLEFNGTSKVGVIGGPVILKSATGNGNTGFWIKSATGTVYAEGPPAIALDK